MEQIHLAQQIRAFRKERRLTQEQLAQALGVTAGAVYKWEAGLSAPDLSLLVALADFFDTSVDVLLGYAPRDNRMTAAAERIQTLYNQKNPTALEEAERALQKYPNAFQVVYAAAKVYYGFGMEKHDRPMLERSRALLDRLLPLMGQNRDAKIGEITIWGKLADIELLLGRSMQAVELLKEHNINGVFNGEIGLALAAQCDRPEEAKSYLSEAMIDLVQSLVRIIFGWLNVYLNNGEDAQAETLLHWALGLLKQLEKEDAVSFLEKIAASLQMMLAYLAFRRKNLPETREWMERARESALRFDASGCYSVERLRYVSPETPASAMDDLGATAMDSLERLLREELKDAPELLRLWREAAGNETN